MEIREQKNQRPMKQILSGNLWLFPLLLFLGQNSPASLYSHFSFHGNGTIGNKPIDMQILLERGSEYANRLRNVSLFVVCHEEIKEEIYDLKGSRSGGRWNTRILDRHEFVYEYQIIRKDRQLYEKRTLLKENGEDKHVEFAQLKVSIFMDKYVLFGPVGLLAEENQTFYDYEIVGEKKYEGEDVILLKTSPKSRVKLKNLYGTLWICKSDFSVIRIEWDQRAVENFEDAVELGNKYNAWPRYELISEYHFEKNGIRFPSRYVVKEDYLTGNGRRIRVSSKTMTYSNYKFFTVETEIKH